MSSLWKSKHTSRCSDLREDAALMAAYHTSLSAHVCLALVCSSNGEGEILDLLLDLALETDERGGCGPLGFPADVKVNVMEPVMEAEPRSGYSRAAVLYVGPVKQFLFCQTLMMVAWPDLLLVLKITYS